MKLLIWGHQYLGDAVLLTTVLSDIHHAYPQADVTLVASPAVCQLLAGHPALTTLHPFHKTHPLFNTAAVLARLQGLVFDVVVGVKPSLRTLNSLRQVRAKQRIMMAKHPLDALLIRLVLGHASVYDKTLHHTQNLRRLFKKVLPLLDITAPPVLWLPVPLASEAFAPPSTPVLPLRPSSPSSKVLGLHLFSSDSAKDYPPEAWLAWIQQELPRLLPNQAQSLQASPPSLADSLDAPPLLDVWLWGSPEQADALEALLPVWQAVLAPWRVHLRCCIGYTWTEIIESLAWVQEQWGVDSVMAHVAASQGVPTFTAFKHTPSHRWAVVEHAKLSCLGETVKHTVHRVHQGSL